MLHGLATHARITWLIDQQRASPRSRESVRRDHAGLFLLFMFCWSCSLFLPRLVRLSWLGAPFLLG